MAYFIVTKFAINTTYPVRLSISENGRPENIYGGRLMDVPGNDDASLFIYVRSAVCWWNAKRAAHTINVPVLLTTTLKSRVASRCRVTRLADFASREKSIVAVACASATEQQERQQQHIWNPSSRKVSQSHFGAPIQVTRRGAEAELSVFAASPKPVDGRQVYKGDYM